MSKKYDFGGYATKVDIKCSDGRVIRKDAFKHHDGQTVPLVWQHMRKDPTNVLGYALLEHRDDGVYTFCSFNETDSGKQAKALVEHGDIGSLSIYANQLKQKGDDVIHGMIREVSLVLAGANPGALIDNINIEHSDGMSEIDETEAIIYTSESIQLSGIEHADSSDDRTIKDVFDTLNEEQKNVVYALIAQAIGEEDASHSDESDPEDDKKNEDQNEDKDKSSEKISHSNEGGTNKMKHNVFEGQEDTSVVTGAPRKTLTHDQFKSIMAEARKCGSLKDALMHEAPTYGIENIDFLFPDAKTITPYPAFIKRDMGWVTDVINGTTHTPFSRIKSLAADITADEARAKGYVKASLKTDEVIALLRRITTPTTVYKKQKLDRDDIIDITDLEVVGWLKGEMRMMLDEELARAVLIGDGRAAEDPDKVNETNIRPIYKDDDTYAHKVSILASATTSEIIDEIIRARTNYKGSGTPALYISPTRLTDMLLLKDTTGRRIYNSEAELAMSLRVSKIVEVAVMEGLHRHTLDQVPVQMDCVGIVVNLKDYAMGADKGGAIGMFDDFDIDYNQYKYLIETRCSGSLVLPKSALVIEQIVEPEG